MRILFLSLFFILFFTGCFESDKDIVENDVYVVNDNKKLSLQVLTNSLLVKETFLDNSVNIGSNSLDASIPVFQSVYSIKSINNSNPNDSCYPYNGFNYYGGIKEYAYINCFKSSDISKTESFEFMEGSYVYYPPKTIKVPTVYNGFPGISFEYGNNLDIGFLFVDYNPNIQGENSETQITLEDYLRDYFNEGFLERSIFKKTQVSGFFNDVNSNLIITGKIETFENINALDLASEIMMALYINGGSILPSYILSSNSFDYNKFFYFKIVIKKITDIDGNIIQGQNLLMIGVTSIDNLTKNRDNIDIFLDPKTIKTTDQVEYEENQEEQDNNETE